MRQGPISEGDTLEVYVMGLPKCGGGVESRPIDLIFNIRFEQDSVALKDIFGI
jgi:hypothetical protein